MGSRGVSSSSVGRNKVSLHGSGTFSWASIAACIEEKTREEFVLDMNIRKEGKESSEKRKKEEKGGKVVPLLRLEM